MRAVTPINADNDTLVVEHFAVMLKVEFLPGQQSWTELSRLFYDRRLAERALEHVSEKYPDAYVGRSESYHHPEWSEGLGEYERLQRRVDRDRALADSLEAREVVA